MTALNPDDIPELMRSKSLKSGGVAWYWSPPTRDLKAGCPIKPEPLGKNFEKACRRAEQLNEALVEWREGNHDGALPARHGTFDWLCELYRSDRRYRRLAQSSKKQVEIALYRFGSYVLKNGTRLGSVQLENIDPPLVDAIYDKLQGKGIRRQAAMCIDSCRKAWDVALRKRPRDIPALNPFAGVDIDRTSEETIPATYSELTRFCDQAIKMGWPQMAFAARVCWDLLQRPIDVFDRLSVAHWRPPERPDHVLVLHNKNRPGEVREEWSPLRDIDPSTGDTVFFYPELEEYAGMLEIKGTLMLMRPRLRGNQKVAKVWDPFPTRFREKLARKIADAAELPAHVGMAAFRHGGLTEAGNAGLPDSYIQALSRHKQRATLDRYVHRTTEQKLAATKMRVAHRRGEG